MNNSGTLKIATIITCHNRREKTLQCLSHLFESASGVFNCQLSVYLVDDGSTDGTSEAIRKKFPAVHIIRGDGNLFWNRGMRLAWSEAARKEYNFFLWLNDDTFLFENALHELLTCARQTENKSIICGSTCSAIDQSTTYGGSLLNGALLSPNGALQTCDYFHGNCVLIPYEVYKKVGLLDPLFHHSIGDIDYGLRAGKLSIDSYVAPYHIGTCEVHDSLPAWCLPSVKFKERVKNLYSPLGNCHPYYFFIFERRHFGIGTAFKHLLSIHIRIVMPQLWKNQLQKTG